MDKEAEPAKAGKAWELPLKMTEITGLIVAESLLLGIVYDASLFGRFDSRLIYLMSFHDHINSAIASLPTALFALFLFFAFQGLQHPSQRQQIFASLHTLVGRMPRLGPRLAGSLTWFRPPDPTPQKPENEIRAAVSQVILVLSLFALLALLFLSLPFFSIAAFVLTGICLVSLMRLSAVPVISRVLAKALIAQFLLLAFVSAEGAVSHSWISRQPRLSSDLVAESSPDVVRHIALIRPLDAGVLYYDPTIRKASFLPWSQVKQLSIDMQ